VPADAEFDSERNHTFRRQRLQAQSIIPANRRSSCGACGARLQMRDNFPTEQHGKRSLIESAFSAVKRKLSCRRPAEPCTRNPAKRCCSAWPSLCTVSGCLLSDYRKKDVNRARTILDPFHYIGAAPERFVVHARRQ
jgi:hypothetical protein